MSGPDPRPRARAERRSFIARLGGFACLAVGLLVLALAAVSAEAASRRLDDEVRDEGPRLSEKTRAAQAALRRGRARDFGEAPAIRQGPLAPELEEALEIAFLDERPDRWNRDKVAALRTIAASGDVRVAWVLADMMRILTHEDLLAVFRLAAIQLMETRIDARNPWNDATDHLMAWDVPAPPRYLEWKRAIFTIIVPEWDDLLVEGEVDWRFVSWGGVNIDDRAFGTRETACQCIPAIDDPPVSSAADATWLEDDDVVFGIVAGGEARAYPRRIMEVREMVNDTLGGVALGIPYCTLCGAAQAYRTDAVPEGIARPILRTSGLLARSNKVMYDLETRSVFDTFRGRALTGPLAARGLVLERGGVVTARWADWKRAHPETTVLREELALGRDPDFRNGRDKDGPIFPVGHRDPRLAVQEDVLGVVTASGRPVAFHVEAARRALSAGEAVGVDEIRLVLDGGGVRAIDAAGADIGAHQAFWFAWSQFHPDTLLWPDDPMAPTAAPPQATRSIP